MIWHDYSSVSDNSALGALTAQEEAKAYWVVQKGRWNATLTSKACGRRNAFGPALDVDRTRIGGMKQPVPIAACRIGTAPATPHRNTARSQGPGLEEAVLVQGLK